VYARGFQVKKIAEMKDAVCAVCKCRIKDNSLFKGLEDGEIEPFKDVVAGSVYSRHEMIFLSGDDSAGLYFIRTGRVKVVRSSNQGKEQILNILGPGDLLGLETLAEGGACANTAVAMDDTELCYISRAEFFDILARSPDIARKLVTSFACELGSAYDRIGTLGLLSAREKLAHLLHALATDYGVVEEGGVRLNLELSRMEIASLLGITQETSIRLLKGFKDEGILEISRREIFIKSPEELREAVGQDLTSGAGSPYPGPVGRNHDARDRKP
jgi:CRP/FNR family transcriptional regulator